MKLTDLEVEVVLACIEEADNCNGYLDWLKLTGHHEDVKAINRARRKLIEQLRPTKKELKKAVKRILETNEAIYE